MAITLNWLRTLSLSLTMSAVTSHCCVYEYDFFYSCRRGTMRDADKSYMGGAGVLRLAVPVPQIVAFSYDILRVFDTGCN